MLLIDVCAIYAELTGTSGWCKYISFIDDDENVPIIGHVSGAAVPGYVFVLP